MTKKKNKFSASARQGQVAAPSNSPVSKTFLKISLRTWLISLIAFALYANTLPNQYTLDDGMVLSNNKLVLKGISAIPDILSHDSFYGSIGDTKNLSGGRYRPLALVAYAIEVSFFGESPFMHHLINVLLYALTCVVLLRFLFKFIFSKNEMAALITTLLFAIHPIHTEVVANIKSRDEIFSLLFLLLTLHYLLLYLTETKKRSHLFYSMLFFSLALFSKENGVIFIVMIPLSIYFFTKKKWNEILKISFPYWIIVVVYVLIRIALLGVRNNQVTEVMDNPYVLATASEKFATIVYVMLLYLQLMLFPYPLTYDYSYHQMPYRQWNDPAVIFSFFIYLLLGLFALWSFRKKDLISWCIIFFFGTLFLVSNLLFNIGAPLADRFLYQASIPFLIAFTELFRRIFSQQKVSSAIQKTIVISFLVIVIILSSYQIFIRNQDWKTDQTLFLHDVKISSTSARANTYAGVALVRLCDAAPDTATKRKDAREALVYFKRSLQIKNDYLPTLLNMGVAYSRIDSSDAAENAWNRARAIDPNDPNLKGYDDYLYQIYFTKGMLAGKVKNYNAAISLLEKAVNYEPTNADGWYNLGGAYFTVNNFEKAKECWEKTLQINPNYSQAKQGLTALPIVKQ
ncbi:MAG: tetratricopeptide repeat protein [Chitinophagales bacterium]